jgi:hypothetical protein
MTRLEELKSKLKAREGQKGYAANVAELKRMIAELEAANGN